MPECKCTTHIIAFFVKKHIFRHTFLFMRVQTNVKIRRSMFGLWAALWHSFKARCYALPPIIGCADRPKGAAVPDFPYFSGTFCSLEHLQISSLGMRSYAFSRSINVTLIFFYHSLCFSIVCFSVKIASVALLPGMNPNWLSCILVHCLILLSTTLSHILKVCDRSLIQYHGNFALLGVSFSLEDRY